MTAACSALWGEPYAGIVLASVAQVTGRGVGVTSKTIAADAITVRDSATSLAARCRGLFGGGDPDLRGRGCRTLPPARGTRRGATPQRAGKSDHRRTGGVS